MTLIELRLFFESLPESPEVGNSLPTKSAFANESKVPLNLLRRLINGQKALSEVTHDKLLVVMRKYSFPG